MNDKVNTRPGAPSRAIELTLKIKPEVGRFFLVALHAARERGARPKRNLPGQPIEIAGSPGWIRTSDHSINSRMLYR